MAASTADWRDKLKVHPICKRLKDAAKKRDCDEVGGDAKSLLAVHKGDLFVWDAYSSCIVHCNLKSLLSVSQFNSANTDERFQVLFCTDIPRFEVDGLALNSCGSHLMLWGSRGIRVLELPQRWGKLAEFEGGKDHVSCRTVSVATRYLSSSQWLKVRQVTWHPGSTSDIHLAVLTSDNIFSVYSLTDPDNPVSCTQLQAGELSTTFPSPSKFNISAALGETAVAFTFGPPQELQPVKRPFQIPDSKAGVTVWPVYVISGNGDIMVTYSEVMSNRPLQLPTQGPLVMCPPAEDNYGVDACSVLCLNTSPPVLVVATCDGRLLHCLILPANSSSKDRELTVAPDMPRLHHPKQPMLYVVESVELELSLTDTNIDLETSQFHPDPFTCPIKLIKDPVSSDRYHCCHSAGVHSVALPWVHTLQYFLSNEACEFMLPEDQQGVVEHLICTKPLYSSPAAPVMGMDVVSDPTLTPTLLVLSMDHEFTALPMTNKYRNPWSGFLRDSHGGAVGLPSPLRRIAAEPFSQHIAKILYRSVSNPLLMAKQKTEMSQQALYHLLTRVTQVLREGYIQKQEQAQQELETRVRILTEQKEQQLADLKSLEEIKRSLRDKAGTLGESLQTCHENQENILHRLEKVMRLLQSRVPVLSVAEKQMHADLKDMKQKTEEFNKNLIQLRAKQEYQQRHLSQTQTSSSPSSTYIGQQQLTHIKDILREEGDEIATLMKQVAQLKMDTNL